MGLKQFNDDVALAKDVTIKRISKIRRGDSDGELVFTYSHDSLPSPLEIQVLLLDVESYPKGSNFMIFTASDCIEEGVIPFLKQLSDSIGRKNVEAVIATISQRLTAKLETNSATDEEFDMYGGFAPDDGEESTAEDDEDDEDDYLFFETNAPKGLGAEPAFYLTASSAKRLKKDLRAAHSAGIAVGVLPEGRSVRQAEIFSLSLRVWKLGIPEDALKAWNLKPDEYLVLLCRFSMGYPSLSELLELPCDQTTVQFRFGKCAKFKPSFATARMPFLDPLDQDSDKYRQLAVEGTEAGDHGDAFVPLCMSNSINLLLNKEFFRLLNTRRTHTMSWDETQEHLFRLSRGGHRPNTASNPPQPLNASHGDDDVPISINAPSSLQHDYALDEERNFSIPLVSMQFALRRLARCTQYCMVCYQRMQGEFEALKPYVCSNSLCLYQYITLGLGSSIEHEVINNPYVVDLLISFFCSAAATQSLREYPKGLNLKSVRTGSIKDPDNHIVAEACFKEKVIKFDPLDFTKHRPIKEGDSIFVVIEGNDPITTASIANGGLERHVCRITDAKDDSYTFEIVTTQTTPLNVQPLPVIEHSTQASNPTDGRKRVLVFQFTHDIDEFSDSDRSIALILLTRGIPSVLKMRAYLLQNPGRRLASWNQIDKNSLTLLHWIVASNRSLILQDDTVPIPGGMELPSNKSQRPEPLDNPNKVTGMPEGWMQFRFLQGTPERERLFVNALQSTGQTNGEQYPTLFAWHGSPLRNWHSIIRTGLDFKTILNGRASGNGVYFSSQLSVSSGYAGRYYTQVTNAASLPGLAWENSQLRPISAISMCEVINRPEKFVSTSPHYVVDKLEWIQCRYLFVEVLPTADAVEQSLPTPPTRNCVGYVKQGPGRQLLGMQGNHIGIPLTALSSKRQHAIGTSGKSYPAIESARKPSSPESLEGDDGGADSALLLDSDNEVDDLPDTRKRPRSASLDSIQEENSLSQFKTDFRPGTLDLKSLPRLPEPTWASSSPAALQSLNRSIKELQKIQSHSDIGSLGWYIDFNNLNNVFHWIVELHSFDAEIPLAEDMKDINCTSVVLELRFGSSYPFSPPFVRVVRPRFLPFARGGGGHVTAGGAICSELLTNSGWSPALTIEKVFLQVRLGLCELDPPARLDKSNRGRSAQMDYGIGEAVEAYIRAAKSHGWQIPDDVKAIATTAWNHG